MAGPGAFAEHLDRALAGALDAAPGAAAPGPETVATLPWLGSVAPARRPAVIFQAHYGAQDFQPTLGHLRARVALESLTASPADWTPADLRAAFCHLAQQYHPDRHPLATPDEIRQLTHAFAAVCANYRRLAATPMN